MVFKREWLKLILAFALVLSVHMLTRAVLVGAMRLFIGKTSTEFPLSLAPLVVSSLVGLTMDLMATPLMVGFMALCLAAVRGEEALLSLLWRPYARIARIAELALVVSGGEFCYRLSMVRLVSGQNALEAYKTHGLVLTMLAPVLIYVTGGFGFCYVVLADEPELGGFEALARSWRLVAGHRFQVIRVWLACGLCIALGAFFCLLPLVAAVPLASLIWVTAYVALRTPSL